jgi:hypothetical protein
MMTPMERFDVRKQAKHATWRGAPSELDDARRAYIGAGAAFYAGADNQHDLFKVELALYAQLKGMFKSSIPPDDKTAA